MLQNISYALIFGKPLIMYLGILTLAGFLFAASIPILSRRGIRVIPFSWHQRSALAAICLAVVHGALGVLAYF
jgi:cobyric acid synthase